MLDLDDIPNFEGQFGNSIGYLASGEIVIAPPSARGYSIPTGVLEQALRRIEANVRQIIEAEVLFDRVLGMNSCVVTVAGDEIVFARRVGQHGLTRFVMNRDREPCTSVVLVLGAGHAKGMYLIRRAYVGILQQPEPWISSASKTSRLFWDNHAIVWGAEPVVSGSETKSLPS